MSAPRKPSADVLPLTITDRSCWPRTGFQPRPWKLALVTLNVPHAKVGQRTVCLASDWVEAVARAAGVEARPAVVRDEDVIEMALRRKAVRR